MNGGNGRDASADAIRADIEQTRERLGDTVEALGAQLNPSHLTQRMKDGVREATIGKVTTMAHDAKRKVADTGRGLIETVKENPIPAAMIAGGIGWLLFSGRRRASSRPQDAYYRAGEYSDEVIDYSRQFPHVDNASGDGAADRVAEAARAARDTVAEKARAASDTVAEKAKAAGSGVASAARSARQGVASGARTAGRQVEETFEDNPLILGAVAAAVGLAVGLTLPASDVESRLMGAKRDELIDRARETLADTGEKVKSAAERAIPEVKDTLKDAARAEGLAPDA